MTSFDQTLFKPEFGVFGGPAEVWGVSVFDEIVDEGEVGANNYSPLHFAFFAALREDCGNDLVVQVASVK